VASCSASVARGDRCDRLPRRVGSRAGASALLGAGIGIAATSLMAFAMLRHGGDADPQRLAWSFSPAGGEDLLHARPAGGGFRSKSVEAAPLLAAYVATFFVTGLGRPLARQTKKQHSE